MRRWIRGFCFGLLAPAGVGAQDAAALLDGTRLTAGTWSYTIRVLKDDAQQGLDFYSQMTLRPASYGGADAWLLLSARRTSGPLIVDSLYLAKRTLAPLHHAVQIGRTRLVNDFSADSVRAVRDTGVTAVRTATRLRPGTLASTDMLELMLPLLPLRSGWRQRFDVLKATDLTTAPFELAVVGEETVVVPAGTVPAWRVEVVAPTGNQRWWVAKSDGRLMKALAVAPKTPDLTVEMVRMPSARTAASDTAAGDAVPATARQDARGLSPGTWLYGVHVSRAGADSATFYTKIDLVSSTIGTDPAWLLVSRRETPGAEILDSVVMVRETLAPVRRSLRSGLASLVHLFTPDSVKGTLVTPNGGGSISLARPPGLLPSTDVFSVLLGLYPLGKGWRQGFDVLNGAGDAVTHVDLAVTGEETVTVPAGTFPSWVVTLTGDGAQQTWWVSKTGQQLVQVRSQSSRAPGTVVTMRLRSYRRGD
jgi:hypothetical protein